MVWGKVSQAKTFWNTISPKVAELLHTYKKKMYQTNQYINVLNTKHNELDK